MVTTPQRKLITVKNQTKNTYVAKRGWIAANPFQRMRGLLPYNSLDEDQCLFLKPGGCIHMRGMKFPLDVIFVDKHLVVVHLVPDLPPEPRWKLWKMTFGGLRADACFECSVGTIHRSHTETGDQLKMFNNQSY